MRACWVLLALTGLLALQAHAQEQVPKPTVLRPTRPVVGTSRPLPGTGDKVNAASTRSSCFDKLSWCASWKSQGYCDPKWFYQNQQVRTAWCPLSCGTCTNAPSCPDLLSWCNQWRDSGYCDPKWVYEGQSVRNYWCKTACGTCSSGSTPSPSPSPSPSPVNGGSGWQATLLSLVNQARAQAGAPALCLNSRLNSAAQAHSQDQANRRTMSHTGSDGSSPGDRVTRAGYSWTAVAENVARGQADATAVFNSWMNSPPHRASILSRNYRHMGAGRADASGGPYWTQKFGASNSQGCS